MTEPDVLEAAQRAHGIMGDSIVMESDQGETEDEEVKRNCILGLSALRDSDFSDTDDSDEDEDDDVDDDYKEESDHEEEQSMEEDKEALVQFGSSGQMRSELKGVCRPTPMTVKLPTHPEDSDEDHSISSSDAEEQDMGDDDNVEEDRLSEHEEAASVTVPVPRNEADMRFDSGDEDSETSDSDLPASQSVFQRALLRPELDEEQVSEADSDDEEEDSNSASDQEDYAAILLAADDPTAISDENDEKMDHEEHVDPEEDSHPLVGASVDDKWTWSKQKRVLSFNTLTDLSYESGRSADVPKRIRSLTQAEPPGMSELFLHVASFDQSKLLPRHDVIRDDSPFASSDEEDRMLSEELEDKLRESGGDNSPIPLLTPPQSPRREDEVEWPSNLVVDSALMNTANDLRPLSPASLQNIEEEEEQRLRNHDIEASTLTPLLRSIYVGTT